MDNQRGARRGANILTLSLNTYVKLHAFPYLRLLASNVRIVSQKKTPS